MRSQWTAQVMTDGEDTVGGKDKLESILPSGVDPDGVRIYGIAARNGRDELSQSYGFFQDIARQSFGKSYIAYAHDSSGMQDVWWDISLQF